MLNYEEAKAKLKLPQISKLKSTSKNKTSASFKNN